MKRIDEIMAELERLRQEPELAKNATIQDIVQWRERIDCVDQILLALLNERSKSANAIGHIKKQLQLPIYVPEREKTVLNNVLEQNEGPLGNGALRALFERIIDETRSLERQRFQKEKDDDQPT